ncbi:unnamed protein product [Tilletia laevis]|uniref:Tryptophan synthase beta chain-like PALP domain-containing protein n=1 Tax=Tilletia laevis TaxID=157183 RepID=A0A9N8LSD6_9BASI|nr:unnamed protein product [Tilletia laevis]
MERAAKEATASVKTVTPTSHPNRSGKGVIACSAGNHAQGVAMAGAHLKVPCTIVMPTGTPEIKSANVARLGAKVVLFGQDFDAAKAECTRLANAHGLTIIHHLRLRREISIFSRLRFVAERADLGERREAMVVVAMDEVSARLSWGNGWA